MNKDDFTQSYLKYNISEDKVCFQTLGIDGAAVQKIAVIAPLHRAEDYVNAGAKVKKLTDGYYPVYEIAKDGIKFTFVGTQIGACNATEVVAALAYSRCEKIIFTGSAGAIKEEISIGEIFLPEFSMCGDGAVKYFTRGKVRNNFTYAEKYYPSASLQQKLFAYMSEQKLTKFGTVKNFSIDTIAGQFLHIDEFLAYGAEVIEMETAAVFCLAEILGLEAVALLNISDSTAAKKSLLGGRTEEELALHKHTESVLVPQLITDFIKYLEVNG